MKSIASKRNDFVKNSVIYFKRVKIFKETDYVMKYRSFGDGRSSRIKN